ncbi:acyltransferase [Aquella oligotrophica]|uniref:Acyltransferase n=1 Tax=Aquella oligotrophica TaxID=2067065 RepID=A0A2I7N5Z4_9NEIS|nr:acyltransferase [Aquella oligotrophica]AUR51851.1 acyltransferase [Aquella oligotrophica]
MKKFVWQFLNLLNKYIAKPRMVLGYTSFDGTYLAKTRISNTVDIVNPENLNIADNVFIGHYNILDASNRIMIGEGCQISNFISILTHSSHQSVRLYGKHYIPHNGRHKGYITGEVIIGKYTFIGAHSVIMPGSKIGKGSLVTAYSLVKGAFPDFAIIAGNPAQVVGDTRVKDSKLLNEYPELAEYYAEWAND